MATGSLPYKIAVLCYIYDKDGHVLLLHRTQNPNRGMYSPVGGKLDVATGEGPHECALREIAEETGVKVDSDDLRLMGIVSERAYEGEGHWLIFLFEVTRPLAREALQWTEFSEGTLEWKRIDEVSDLPIPRTDREVMWPLVQSHHGGFFTVHIDWSEADISWKVHESVKRQETSQGPERV